MFITVSMAKSCDVVLSPSFVISTEEELSAWEETEEDAFEEGAEQPKRETALKRTAVLKKIFLIFLFIFLLAFLKNVNVSFTWKMLVFTNFIFNIDN